MEEYKHTTHTDPHTHTDTRTHQQQISRLNTNRNMQTVLLVDSLINGLSRYKKTWNSFFEKSALNCGIRGDNVENLLCRAENLEITPTIRQVVIHCGTNNIEANKSNNIAFYRSTLKIKKKNSVTNIFITLLLSRHFRETRIGNKIKKINELIKAKCLSISTTLISYIEQEDDWIDERNCLLAKYYYIDQLHLEEIGNKKLSNTIIKAIKHSNLTLPMNTKKYIATTAFTREDFLPSSRHSTKTQS